MRRQALRGDHSRVDGFRSNPQSMAREPFITKALPHGTGGSDIIWIMFDIQGARLQLQILDEIRSGRANTRPNVVRVTGLGRSLVNQRLDELIELDLIHEGDVVAVPRGRSPRAITFYGNKAQILCADIGATGLFVGLADLAGQMHESVYIPHDVSAGPEATLTIVEREFNRIVASRSALSLNVWGIGIGLPGPVEFGSGWPVTPPIMPSWSLYNVRDRLQRKYNVPVWVDNDTNLMAIGELRAGAARGAQDAILFKISTGVGAALISRGEIHRGAQGAAGDVGHVQLNDFAEFVCRCGKGGCLEAVAGGWALARQAETAAAEDGEGFLTRVGQEPEFSMSQVIQGYLAEDPTCMRLVNRSARLVGEAVAQYINFFNPTMVLLGGRLLMAGNSYLAAVRTVVYERSLPLATRDLIVTSTELGDLAALYGAGHMAIDEIFRPKYFATWTPSGAPTII